jgi:NAD(P)-dependent dehydrogenase (short-subunit alcohol dehydrogenase family)
MSERTVFVSGASAGIGRATALLLAREGWTVFAGARRADALAALAAEAPAGSVVPLALDVTDESSVRAAADEAFRRTGGAGPAAVVNNAGYSISGPLEDVSDADLKQQFAVNVFGVMAVTRAFVPAMRRRGAGRVVNISSIVGRVSAPFQGPYAASKHALEALSDALRAEVAPFGVRVVVVQPGPVRTEFFGVLRQQMDACNRPDTPYANHFNSLDEIVAAMEKSAVPAERVARVVRKALATRWPASRYVVPRRQRVIMALATNLPAFLTDAGKRSFYRHRAAAANGTAPPTVAPRGEL